MTQRSRYQIQAAETSVLRGVAGPSGHLSQMPPGYASNTSPERHSKALLAQTQEMLKGLNLTSTGVVELQVVSEWVLSCSCD